MSEQGSMFDVCPDCGGVGGDHGEYERQTPEGPRMFPCPRRRRELAEQASAAGLGHVEEVEAAIDSAVEAFELPDPGKKAIGGFRKGARETSRKAAISVYPKSGSSRLKVLQAFIEAGSRGLTHDELTDRLSPHNPGISTYRSRASELAADEGEDPETGWIKPSGFERKSRSDRPSTVWILTEAAKRAILERGKPQVMEGE